jgi:broad specificity phosphatase PhoE
MKVCQLIPRKTIGLPSLGQIAKRVEAGVMEQVQLAVDRYRSRPDMGISVGAPVAPVLETLQNSIPSGRLPVLMDADTRLLSYKKERSRLKKSFEGRGISLYAMRHGQSEMNANVVPTTSGQIETPLTKKGARQAREGAKRLYEQYGGRQWLQDLATGCKKMPAIYSSPLSRAHDTARVFVDYIAEQGRESGLTINLPIQLDDRLMEMHFGRYEGRPDAESLREHPSTWADDEFVQRCPEGESRVDVMERLWSFLEDVRGRHENQEVLMFCHLMPCALTRVLMGDGSADSRGALQIHRSKYPNATPIEMTRPMRPAGQLGNLLA